MCFSLRSSSACFLTTAFCATLGHSVAREVQTGVVGAPPPAASAWDFRIEPYGWLTGLDGTVGVDGLNTGLDVPFSDILDHLDMAAALQLEARNGRWGIMADGFYAGLSGSGSPPGPLYKSIEADFKQFIGELSVSYRVYESPGGSIDLYGGIRYSKMTLDLGAVVDETSVIGRGNAAGDRIREVLARRADQIRDQRAADFAAAAGAARAAVENEVRDAIRTEASDRVEKELRKQLLHIRRGSANDGFDLDRIERALREKRIELVKAAAEEKIAELRASVDASLEGKVADAKARVEAAKRKLADSLNKQLKQRLPVSASADRDWTDPIIGARARWNYNDRWFIAGRGDVGGFEVGSDFTWSLLGAVGYDFTESVSVELGYRYLHTDYTDGGFKYDLGQSGLYTGLNFRF